MIPAELLTVTDSKVKLVLRLTSLPVNPMQGPLGFQIGQRELQCLPWMRGKL